MDILTIERRLRLLTFYAFGSSGILLLMFISAFSPVSIIHYGAEKFFSADTLHVRYLAAERVDIIEPDGNLAIALSNSVSSAKLQFDGQILDGASNRDIPNIIFFDGKGDEVGGLAFANFDEEGSPMQAIRHLAFDGFRQDEVITLSHFVQNGKSRKGVFIYDRPDLPIMDALRESGIEPEDNPNLLNQKMETFQKDNPDRYQELWANPRRVAVQTNEDDDAELLLADAKGNIRLRFVVKPDGDAYIEFLDEGGDSIKVLKP